MAPAPSVPAAPGLFSTMTCCPRYFAVASANARMQMSVEPPAGQGTISVTGFEGNCWADAAAANASAAAPRMKRLNMVLLREMRDLSIPVRPR